MAIPGAQVLRIGGDVPDRLHGRLDALIETEARLGRPGLPRGTLDERHTHARFERSERAIDRLERPPQVAGRRRLAALLDDRQEGLQVVHPFHSTLLNIGRIYENMRQL
jgi:hypothetical protein